jgi:hypothetical protein
MNLYMIMHLVHNIQINRYMRNVVMILLINLHLKIETVLFLCMDKLPREKLLPCLVINMLVDLFSIL